MLSDRPEIELMEIRPLASVTVARTEFMNREYGFASPISGNERLRHEYRAFARTARLVHVAVVGPGLAPESNYIEEVRNA